MAEYMTYLHAYIGDNPIVNFIVVILLTIVFAQIVAYTLVFLSKTLVYKTKTDLDDKILNLFRKPIFLTIVFTGTYLAFGASFPQSHFVVFSLVILKTLLIWLWAVFLVRLIKVILRHCETLETVKLITTQTVKLFSNISVALIWIFAGYFMFIVWGVNVTAWLASAGVVGIAIGFAAKDTLANLISGVFILTDAPFKIGDYILLDNGERGKVMDIGMRSTRIQTVGGMEVTIPNATIGGAMLTNESGGPSGTSFCIKIPFGVAYGTDIDKMEKIVHDIVRKNDNTLNDPAPSVRFLLFGASSLDYMLYVWVKDSTKKGVAIHEINRAIYTEFNKNDIEIPYTKQEVYIKEMPR